MSRKLRISMALVLTVLLMMFMAIWSLDAFASENYLWPNDSQSTSRGFENGHLGQDITGSYGSNVYATKSGTVIKVYSGCGNIDAASTKVNCPCSSCSPNCGTYYQSEYGIYACNYGYGNGVVIQHDDGSGFSMYAHMSSISVSQDQKVSQGQVIGKVGSSGNSSGTHLHFELSSGGWMSGNYFEPGGSSFNNNKDVIPYIYGSPDTTAPTISKNVVKRSISPTEFAVDATVTDNVGVSRVWAIVWPETTTWENGKQIDAVSQGGNRYTVSIPTKDFNNYVGKYQVDLYATDAAGNTGWLLGTIVDRTPPTLTDFQTHVVSKSKFTVEVDVTDDEAVDRVWCVIWPDNTTWENGKQPEMTSLDGKHFTLEVTSSQFDGYSGIYHVDVYASDKVGNYNYILHNTTTPLSAGCENHIWNDGEVTAEPTCTETGTKLFTCTSCGETKTETIPAKGHSWDEGVVVTPASLSADGVKRFTCEQCKLKKKRTFKLPAGWYEEDGYKYYITAKHVPVTGAKTIENKVYYFDETGKMHTGWLDLKGRRYYFGKDGSMVTGVKKIEGKTYYFNNKGIMQVGWLELDGNKYFLDKNGVVQTGWKKIDGTYYCFSSKGIMMTGWTEYKGNKYYLNEDGTLHTGWIKIDGKWYRFSTKGAMIIGWTQYKNNRYYLDETGAMVKNCKIVIDGQEYIFDKNGVCQNPSN